MKIMRSWREQKVMLKSRFPFLNDLDFDFEEGNRESMLQKLAVRLNKSRTELELLFADLQRY
jgi:sporulation-control protein spo0M